MARVVSALNEITAAIRLCSVYNTHDAILFNCQDQKESEEFYFVDFSPFLCVKETTHQVVYTVE